MSDTSAKYNFCSFRLFCFLRFLFVSFPDENLIDVSAVAQVRPNTDGKLPYPYKPQGLLSVELID